MGIEKSILQAGLAAQAAGLALSNIPGKKKKTNLLGQGFTNILGTSLIAAQAPIIGGL